MDSLPSSSANAADNDFRECLVCGAEAHGIHFQVNSCRACAAFFRRSTEASERYKCRSGSFECDVSKSAPHNCRSCRLQRCKQVGMNLTGVKNVYDDAEVPDPFQPSNSKQNANGEIDEELPEVVVENYKFTIDTDKQMEKIVEILSRPFVRCQSSRETPLQSLIRAYHNMVPGGKPDKIKLLSTIVYAEYVRHLHTQMERIAEFAMQCEEYAELPLTDKRKVYCVFWHAVYAFERYSRTIEFTEPDTPPNVHLYTDNTAFDLVNNELDMPGFHRQKARELDRHFRPFGEFLLNNFAIPMRKMNLTTFEVVYLCLYKMWSIKKVKDLSPRTYEVAATILEDASNELHEYYVNELRISNYAGRLSQLFKLVTGLDSAYRYRTERRLAADVCKMYQSSYEDSEFCDYTRH